MSALATAVEPVVRPLIRLRENANQRYFTAVTASPSNMFTGDFVVTPKLTDSMLAYAYLEFEKQKLLPWIFYEGIPSLRWFLEKYSEIETLGCFTQAEGKSTATLRGLGWVNSLTMMGQHKKAEVGMAFFRETDQDTTRLFGQMMTEWAFNKLGLNALHGSTPIRNRAAMLYMQSLGFEHVGPVEGYTEWRGELCAVEISFMTRTRWLALSPFEVVKE